MEIFNASSAPMGDDRTEKLLRQMESDASDRRLLEFFDEIDTMIDESRERDREQGLDPEIAARLHAITGAEDAPFEFRSLHRRVQAGTLTWEKFWMAPEEEAGGADLIHAAMQAEGDALGKMLAAIEVERAEQAQSNDRGPQGGAGSR